MMIVSIIEEVTGTTEMIEPTEMIETEIETTDPIIGVLETIGLTEMLDTKETEKLQFSIEHMQEHTETDGYLGEKEES